MHCCPAPPWMSSSALIADAIAPLIGSPQVTAMREIAIDGACGPWSTPATSAASSSFACPRRRHLAAQHQPDHLREAQLADQLLDRVAAHRDAARLDVDDPRRPPALGFVERLCSGGFPLISHPPFAGLRSLRRCSRGLPAPPACAAPSCGGGVAASGSPSDILKPARATVIGRSTPGTSGNVCSSSRVATCSDCSASGTVSHAIRPGCRGR